MLHEHTWFSHQKASPCHVAQFLDETNMRQPSQLRISGSPPVLLEVSRHKQNIGIPDRDLIEKLTPHQIVPGGFPVTFTIFKVLKSRRDSLSCPSLGKCNLRNVPFGIVGLTNTSSQQ
ncbi:hypothetical protein BU198_41450 [Streptomyces sp. CBMA156]|nr:hypothetical protein [Streptomyces sp. CBMA156]